MRKPVISTFNGWKSRRRHIAMDGGIVVDIFGIRMVDLCVTICLNPFDYELTFGIIGFAITVSGGGNVRSVGSVFDE